MTSLNRDFRDVLSSFNDAGVEYLVVGAYALAAHGLPRATGDNDDLILQLGVPPGRVDVISVPVRGPRNP